MGTAVIVQARMASTRLPGKIMLDLCGRTVLAHVLERCAGVEGADVVCCATVEGPDGDVIGAEAERCGAAVFKGSEFDALDRYYRAARMLGADVILRVTSDCPVIDPEVCAAVLRLLEERTADLACNNMPPSWPHGLDCQAVTFPWLERAAKEAVRPSDREHVTTYIRHHAEARKVNLEGPGGSIVRHRWTLDTEADLRFLRALFERLPPGPEGWSYKVPLAIVEADPALAAINAGQDRLEGYRKAMEKDAEFGFAPREFR